MLQLAQRHRAGAGFPKHSFRLSILKLDMIWTFTFRWISFSKKVYAGDHGQINGPDETAKVDEEGNIRDWNGPIRNKVHNGPKAQSHRPHSHQIEFICCREVVQCEINIIRLEQTRGKKHNGENGSKHNLPKGCLGHGDWIVVMGNN
jgi:hypothetical protein